MSFVKLFVLISSFVLISCETTKILYKDKIQLPLNKLAYLDVSKSDTNRINKLFPKLDSTYKAACSKYANRFLCKESLYQNESINFDAPDTTRIIELCEMYQLDGIILSKVIFRFVSTSFNFIPTGKYEECILSTKIYSKNGKLKYHVVHDSKDDSYKQIPSVYDVVSLSVGISYKKINSTSVKIN